MDVFGLQLSQKNVQISSVDANSMEVEDIMCDQSILYSDVNVLDTKISYLVIRASKLWVAIDLIARSIFPPLSTVYYSIFHNPQELYQNVRHQIFPAIVAILANSISRSLASVQNISIPGNLRIAKDRDSCDRAIITDANENEVEESEKSVECLILSEPEEITIDVIFIHGLHGGLHKTWRQGDWRTSKHKISNQSPVRRHSRTHDFYVPIKEQSLKRTLSNIYSQIPNKIARFDVNDVASRDSSSDDDDKKREYSNCWPRDWIPQDCPNARVIALNYTTDVLWCPTWVKKRKRTNLVERSKEMIKELLKIGVGQKPILWVGHSKGGLFIKQILINAFDNIEERREVRNIFNETKAIVWYSVPHRGSYLADFTLPLLRRSIELLEIQRNCSFVMDLHRRFCEIIDQAKPDIDIFSFIETSFTVMSCIFLKIVVYRSADPDMGIKCDVPLDHREICKPAAQDCFLYLEVIKKIKQYEIQQNCALT